MPSPIDDYTVRAYRPGDEHQINDLFNEVFGLSRSLDDWRAKFHAFGQAPRILLFVDADDRIVTHYAATEIRFEMNGQHLTFLQPVDVFSVRQEAAVAGRFFVRAAETFIAWHSGSKVPVFFGFPGPRAYRLGKIKWKYKGDAPVTAWTSPRQSRRLGQLLAGLIPDGTEEGVERFPDACDRLWAIARTQYPAATTRDALWVRERYLRRGAGRYRSVLLRRGEEIAAWAIYVVEGGSARIADFVWDGRSDDEARRVLDRVRRNAGAAGIRHVELWSPPHGPMADLLRRLTWTDADQRDGAYLVVQSHHPSVDESWLRKAMFYSLGDSDLI